METPLKIPGALHFYSRHTPLQLIGWNWQTFGRCNTSCENCFRENGVLLCAAKPETLNKLPGFSRPPPPREITALKKINWRRETELCLWEHGYECTLQQAYAWFLKKYPELTLGKVNWQFKIRVAIQLIATRTGPGRWKSKTAGQQLLTPLSQISLVCDEWKRTTFT